jgi:hypothetical protein
MHCAPPAGIADVVLVKKAKDEAILFAEAGPAEANDREVLLWALMLCVTHRGRVKELDSFARNAVLEEQHVSISWKPDKERWPPDTLYKISKIFMPLYNAHRVVWTKGALDAIGLAMQGWRGKGFISNVRGDRLKEYINKPRLGPKVESKTLPPPRYRSSAIVRVARLLVDHGPALRRLLNRRLLKV